MVMHKTSNFVVRTVHDKNRSHVESKQRTRKHDIFSLTESVFAHIFEFFFEGVNNSRLGQKCKLGTVA